MEKKINKKNTYIILAGVTILFSSIGHFFLDFPYIYKGHSITIDLELAKVQHKDRVKELERLFVKESVIKPPEIVECTLSQGTKTACFSITLDIAPRDFTPGPWCPRHIHDNADKGGLWLKDSRIHNVDGAFIENLAAFYNDDSWQMYDSNTGSIFYTETAEECAAAARPNVSPKYYNHCVECKVEHMEEGASITYVIPLEPVMRYRPEWKLTSGIGVSFSGAKIETSAPLHAILDAHTIAPFDDCGGHVNLHVGYHLHAITGCIKEVETGEGNHAAMIGYAMDGFPIYMKNNKYGTEANNLDECRGHETPTLGYHYHVADPGKNMILPCLKAQSGCVSTDPNTPCDASKRKRPPY